MREEAVLVLDCGSTNVRAIAVGASGAVLARAAEKNATIPDPQHENWHYWPFEQLFDKLASCARQVAEEIGAARIRAITVTTFGADGSFLDAKGNLLHPVISWKCARTLEAQDHVAHYIDPDRLMTLSGIGRFPFNTLNKFVWFREHHPDLLDRAEHFLFISSLFTHRLTGRLTNDATMVGTSQMTDLLAQDFSAEILEAIGARRSLFPEMVFPGEVIGPLLPDMACRLGLEAGIPVVSAGHDTQFAIFGAGASADQPVLSSGTWEILMARCASIALPSAEIFKDAFTCEWDVKKGHYTPGYQYVASAVVEWVARIMYPDLSGSAKYETMIGDAMAAPDDCLGMTFHPDMLVGKGAIANLSLDVDRGIFFRAALNGLVKRLQTGLALLEQVGQFKASKLILVGGGTRNQFWTQLKANALGIPIYVLDEPETTVLGASMVAMQGAGLHESAEAARQAYALQAHVTMPQ